MESQSVCVEKQWVLHKTIGKPATSGHLSERSAFLHHHHSRATRGLEGLRHRQLLSWKKSFERLGAFGVGSASELRECLSSLVQLSSIATTRHTSGKRRELNLRSEHWRHREITSNSWPSLTKLVTHCMLVEHGRWVCPGCINRPWQCQD